MQAQQQNHLRLNSAPNQLPVLCLHASRLGWYLQLARDSLAECVDNTPPFKRLDGDSSVSASLMHVGVRLFVTNQNLHRHSDGGLSLSYTTTHLSESWAGNFRPRNTHGMTSVKRPCRLEILVVVFPRHGVLNLVDSFTVILQAAVKMLVCDFRGGRGIQSNRARTNIFDMQYSSGWTNVDQRPSG